jgi:probable HAF family extracellular repeat protein
MADLGVPDGGWYNSAGYAINNSGQVAGEVSTGTGSPYRAIRYTGGPGNGGVVHELGTLGGYSSHGRAINASGQVAGYSQATIGDAPYRAFLYTGTPGSGGAMHDLGTLGERSFAYAVNDAAQVAGYSEMPGNTVWHAFLYTGTPGADGQMTDLDTWFDGNNPAEGDKWTLMTARGLTNGGLITGDGSYDDGPGGLSDGTRAYILDASALVPEPAAGLSLLAIVCGALRRRARCTGGRTADHR